MPIVFKSPLSSSVANATFLDKTVADLKTGKLSLCKVDTLEVGYIDDVQQAINNNTDASASNTGSIIALSDIAIKSTDAFFSDYDEKTELVEDDVFLLNDSENSGEIKYVKVANLIGGGGGGAGSSIEWVDGDIAPVNEYSNGLQFKVFGYESEQEMFFSLTVPESYSPGDQIKLTNTKIIGGGFSADFNLVARTYLLDTSDYTDRTNFHDSTNVAVTGSVGTILEVVDIDLTDGSGEINSVAVAPYDTILIRLMRDSVSTSDIKMIKNSPVIKLK